MTFDDYGRAISAVHEELKRVAEASATATLSGADDNDFEALIQRHVELVKLTTSLTERMFVRYKARP